jgi:hypothetical protein
MELAEQEWHSILLAQLTYEERAHGVLYASPKPIPAGTTLKIAAKEIVVPWNALLAFCDSEPMANWGHPCRYLLTNQANGEIFSINARFPPFRKKSSSGWRIVHRAVSAPDWALLTEE